MTSIKNQLQEFLQKKGNTTVPIYNTIRVEGDDHNPLFLSTVTLPDEQEFVGEKKTRKKDAEMSAAAIAISSLFNTIEKQTHSNIEFLTPVESALYILLIDLENINLNSDILCKLNPTMFYIQGFLSVYHARAICDDVMNYPFYVYKINSAAKEAADHAMSYWAGSIAERCIRANTNPTFIILSRDQSSANLVTLLHDNFEVAHFTNVKEFEDWIIN